MLLLHDNAMVYKVRKIQLNIEERNLNKLDHPPSSSDFAPSIQKPKKKLRGLRFPSDKCLKEAAGEFSAS